MFSDVRLAVVIAALTGMANAANLPTSGSVVIENAGVYTVDENCTLDSILISAPEGSAGSRVVTTFDLTTTPGRTVTVTGANPQFNVTNHYSDVAFLGGIWNFSGDFYLGNENSSTLGRDAFRRLFIQDGAEFSATNLMVNFGTGGSEMHVSNATVSVASDLRVQQASAMTTDFNPDNCGKLVVTAGGKVSVGNTLYVQYPYTSSNMRQSGLLSVSGTGAEVNAKYICVGDAPSSRAQCGGRVLVDDGGLLSSSLQVRLGCSAYTYYPSLSDVLSVSNASFSGVHVYVGYGDNVTNARAEFTNSTVSATGDFYCGYGAGAASNSVVFSKCADLALVDDLVAGFGAGSHDNFIGFYDCGPITLPSGKSWYSGRGAGAYRNTILFSNTVVTTDRDVSAGGNATSMSNEVVFAGPLSRLVLTSKQRDVISYGTGHRCLFTDGAAISADVNSVWLFKYGFDSEVIVEDGASINVGVNSSSGFFVGKVTPSGGVTYGNSLYVKNGGSIACTGSIQVGATNTSFVVSDATVSAGAHLQVGVMQTQSVTDDAPAKGCRLVVSGTQPRITLGNGLTFVNGSESVLRFELSGNGYSWPDDPDRVAPIELTNSSYTMTIGSGTVLEVGVSKMHASAFGRPIPLVKTKKAMSIDATALANANAAGRNARHPYTFSVSEDSMTLYVTVETRGLAVIVE